MRSPLAALFIGCAALLSPRAALGSRVPVFVYRAPPTATPTSSPSSSLQPSLRPSSPPVTISSSALEEVTTTSSSELAAPSPSPYGLVWIAPVVVILLAFIGAMYKLDKKQKLKKKTAPSAAVSAGGATATTAEGDKDGGLTGWLSSLWPNNQYWPNEGPETGNEANNKKEVKKETKKVAMTV